MQSSKDGRRKDLLDRNVGERIKGERSYLWAFNDGYSKVGEMQFADRYFDEMLGCGLMPNNVIYTTLIDGHCRKGNITEAFSVF